MQNSSSSFYGFLKVFDVVKRLFFFLLNKCFEGIFEISLSCVLLFTYKYESTFFNWNRLQTGCRLGLWMPSKSFETWENVEASKLPRHLHIFHLWLWWIALQKRARMGQAMRKGFLRYPVQVALSYAPFHNSSNSTVRVGGLFDSVIPWGVFSRIWLLQWFRHFI